MSKIKNDQQYAELCNLRDTAQARIDGGLGMGYSGVHYDLMHFLQTKLGIIANGRQDSVLQATNALEEYERERWGTSASDDRYLNAG